MVRVLMAFLAIALACSTAMARPHLLPRFRQHQQCCPCQCHPQAPASFPLPMPSTMPLQALPPATAPAPCPPGKDCPKVAVELLACFNAERARFRLPALVIDATLNTAAAAHSALQATRSRLFHDRNWWAEIIAWNYSSASDVTGGWMRSTVGHREMILGKFTRVGFGVAYNRKGEPYWTARFQ